MLQIIMSFLGSPISRAFDVIEKNIEAKTDREAIKGEIIKAHYSNRAAYMRAGGFWLMVAFAAPLAFWFTAVVVYSVFWCAGCAFPQGWTIAALPPPLDEWAGVMIVSIFGVIGVTRLRSG